MKLMLIPMVMLAGCASFLSIPRLAKEDATVIVRCSADGTKGSQLIVVLLDHSKALTEEEAQQKRRLQKIAEIEVDPQCHFTVRAPKTPMELSTQPRQE